MNYIENLISDQIDNGLLQKEIKERKREMVGKQYKTRIIINLNDYLSVTEIKPHELAYLPNGSVNDEPSFAVIGTTSGNDLVVAQFSLQTLRLALMDVGYDLIINKKRKNGK